MTKHKQPHLVDRKAVYKKLLQNNRAIINAAGPKIKGIKCRAAGCNRKTRNLHGFCFAHVDMLMHEVYRGKP